MNLNNDCRKLIPCVEFKADPGIPLADNTYDLAGFYDRDFVRVELDEHKASVLTNCFKKPTFEGIAEAVADAVNSDAFRHESHCAADSFIGDVYLLQSVGDRIHMRFYVVGEMEAKWFQDVTDSHLGPDESLGHVWVLTPEQLNTWEMRDYFTWFCGVVVDLNTNSLWRLKK